MKRFTPFAILFFALYTLTPLQSLAQVNDGAMQVQMRFERFWAESGDDIFPDADEFVNYIRVQDYPNLDGVGWQNSSSTVNPAWGNGAFQTGGPYFGNFSPDWVTTYTYGAQNTLGPQPSIEGFRMGFQGWEDDCHSCAGGFLCLGSPCGPPNGRTTYNSSCPCGCDCLFTGGDDQFCDQEHLPNSFDGFRNGAPYTFTYQGVTHTGNPGFTGSCGGNDVGADYSTWWTSPCPDTLYANRTVICEPGLVTLFTGGAVFGGEYVWYEGNNFLQVTADIVPYLTVYLTQTTTYRVYTRNGIGDSWSYREIQIVVDQPNISNIQTDPVSCNGLSDGLIRVNATTNYPPLEYSIDNGNSYQLIDSFIVSAGNYIVKIRNPYCEVPTFGYPVTVTEPGVLDATIADIDSVSCNGGNDGAIDLTVTGGNPPFNFNWSNGNSSEDNINIPAGSYSVTVTDDENCSVQETYTINEPAALTAVISGTPPTCFGSNDARASVTVLGGTSPYRYLWSNFSLADSAINLQGGIVTVIVTDDNGCETNDTINLPEPNEIRLIEKIGMVDCPGDSTGGLIITAVGGVQPYSYLWSPTGDTTNALSNLPAGTYTIVVTDATGCTKTGTYTITEPPALATVVTGNNPTCAGNATGFAVITVTGGTPGYTYEWSTVPPQNGVIGINLESGLYTVTATDANSCTITDSVTITDPDSVRVSTVPTNITCFAGDDGRVEIRATGGSRPYKYFLNGIFQTDSIYTGLTEGNYIVVVEDNNACIGSTLFSITAPTGFSANAGPDQQIVRGDIAILTGAATSPNGIRDFIWSPNQNLSCINCQQTEASPDQDQVYVLEVIDNQGCVQFDTVLVVVKQDYQNFFPTVFSPNGDGLNDNFDFELLGADGGQMTIYNRWGEQVYFNAFQANGAGNGWDGNINGKLAPEETYVYQLEVTYFDGETEVLSGTISIVR